MTDILISFHETNFTSHSFSILLPHSNENRHLQLSLWTEQSWKCCTREHRLDFAVWFLSQFYSSYSCCLKILWNQTLWLLIFPKCHCHSIFVLPTENVKKWWKGNMPENTFSYCDSLWLRNQANVSSLVCAKVQFAQILWWKLWDNNKGPQLWCTSSQSL